SADVSDPHAIAFGNYLKICNVKDCERDIGEIPESRIVERDRGIRRRRFAAVGNKTCRHVESRIASSIGAAVEMHRVGQVTASYFSIVAYDVATIDRIHRCKAGRLEPVSACNGIRSAK